MSAGVILRNAFVNSLHTLLIRIKKMIHLQMKIKPSVFASFFLMCSFTAFAYEVDNVSVMPHECSSDDASKKQCMYFVRGYIDALLQLNEVGLKSNLSAFEERVYKTRVGKANQTNFLEQELNLCLPKVISTSEILAAIDTKLSLKSALLKVLQVKYPCQK